MSIDNTIHILYCRVQQWNLSENLSARVYVEASYVTEDYVE
ncbi:hypothetical protein [uncultured Flavobacterium sp.]|nr:hypothetical protein [uncultured Flavobacterium sp.]